MKASTHQGIIRVHQYICLELAARRSSESAPVTDTAREDVLEEASAQQVSSAFLRTPVRG